MTLDEACAILEQSGLNLSLRCSLNGIIGGMREEFVDDIRVLSGNVFSIYEENGRWAADFGTAAIVRMSDKLDDVVEAVLNFFGIESKRWEYSIELTEAFSRLLKTHLVAEIASTNTLRIYETTVNFTPPVYFTHNFVQSAHRQKRPNHVATLKLNQATALWHVAGVHGEITLPTLQAAVEAISLRYGVLIAEPK